MSFESLENRALLAAVPFGAAGDDTAEFLLGDVLVTVVLMESSEQTSVVNDNSEDWTSASIAEVKQKVQAGMQWWTDTLAGITDRHELNFHYDFTYADQPVATSYEPITRPSTDFRFWIYDFLNVVGYNQTGDFGADIRQFNHAQRVAHETHWAFTVFVVNDENDADGLFAPGGFTRAFAFAGGQFIVSPAARPASTFAHEAGHMFWARDEYAGGGSYSDFRGYYNTQNVNAWNNPEPGFSQVPSIMDRGDCEAGGGLLCTAYQNHTSSPSSLEMVGWRDTDDDGVFDVLDVPLELTGTGVFDPDTGLYRFRGESSVQTLPNLNPSGFQNDITINTVGRAEFRVDGGEWQTAAEYSAYQTAIELDIPVSAAAATIEIRTADPISGVTSEIFLGALERPSTAHPSGISGFVWEDSNRNGTWEFGEQLQQGTTIQLVDSQGEPLSGPASLEPDDFGGSATLLNQVLSEVTLSAVGSGVADNSVTAVSTSSASTGQYVFGGFSAACGGFCSDWTPESRRLRIDFNEPLSTISLDAVGRNTVSFGRLEAFNQAGELIGRYTTQSLAEGEVETMTLSRADGSIAYIIAGGHSVSSVRLDNLSIGSESQTTTDSFGVYAFGSLLPGTYHVRVMVGANQQVVTPAAGQHEVSLGEDPVSNIDFGIHVDASPWQNHNNALDVNNDGFVSPIDVLNVINDINQSGPRQLTSELAPPFVDVNGDGFVTSQDALVVINELNFASTAESESPEFEAKGTASAPPTTMATFHPAEGEGPSTQPGRAMAVKLPDRISRSNISFVSQRESPRQSAEPLSRIHRLDDSLLDVLAWDLAAQIETSDIVS